ncbi:hypothetical protein [Vibrio parahaemolyticus]|uniref:Uncharacterized protein n=1 Tax=Vibrio phage vB_ValM-yong1 TaxID=2660715 RepID=A0A6M3A3J6_9CAUD|nr:hypothetical protein [Vibrio parahaemolyticus]YP_009885055.1 hypothetical protein HYQ07_gp23 [Vibrio phage Valm-yong1]HCZ9306334.1 hypothetical protein [Vibrio alginolyticus]MBM5118026.1 hypothetical protein [Vibrio parahaemolyticus]MBM5121404.1 hypothetical protein [Vibrio parahaemolyticus]MBM5131817.1 hypothetical protein [Vibrio parahaemolyticus]MBM5138598.1 hypothetical protein [Vibrio parahaemolyticus]
MKLSKELISRLDVILEEEARLGFITEGERRLVVKTLEKAAESKPTEATE